MFNKWHRFNSETSLFSDTSTCIDIRLFSGTEMEQLNELVKQRNERMRRSFIEPEKDETQPKEPTCDDLYEKFGRDYCRKLTTFTETEVDEILSVCEETLRPIGPGRRYHDIKYRVIIYLTWLTSGWTIRGLSNMFGLSPSSVQRTISYAMSGMTNSLKKEYLPEKRSDITSISKFKHFPQALGAVDASLIPIQKPKDSMLNNDYYSGKHSMHGAKIQVTVDADGKAIHISPLIPGRRHDAYLFRNSGLAEFMKKVRRGSGRTEITHPALLADSGYTGLDEIYYELIVCKKRPPHGELSQKDFETNSKLHSDRVLVENFFGRLKTTFGILSNPYRCALNSLEDVVITCICLLNLKLRAHPLRAIIEEEYGGAGNTNNNNVDTELSTQADSVTEMNSSVGTNE